jgi:hypothetical protein
MVSHTINVTVSMQRDGFHGDLLTHKESNTVTTIELTLPPSTNALWRSSRSNVHRSRRYIEWLTAAGWVL